MRGGDMTQTCEAIFDGEVFHLTDRIQLTPNKHYILTVREKAAESKSEGVWDVLDSLSGTIEAPEDWSLEHDHYLYGTPRKKNVAQI